jgi:hypothetical protein
LMKQMGRYWTNLTAVFVFCILLVAGCGKEEKKSTEAAGAAPGAGSSAWQATLPAQFSRLMPKDGGMCALDFVAGTLAKGEPIRIASRSPASFEGWAIVDVGRVGRAVGIQLKAATPYFVVAQPYHRPGLGAALGGTPGLDEGGVKLDAIPLAVTPGDYRVFFLMQSDSTLLQCDTRQTLHVE